MPEPEHARRRPVTRRGSVRRHRRRAWTISLSVVGALLIIGAAVAWGGWSVYSDARTAESALQRALPLTGTLTTAIEAGDADTAHQSAAEFRRLTAEAVDATSGSLWTAAQAVPVVGPNLAAVRAATRIADDLGADLVEPAADIDLAGLAGSGGGFDLAALEALAATTDRMADAVDAAVNDLAAVDRASLVEPVDAALDRLDAMLTDVQGALGPARSGLAVLPDALGASGARNYLVLVQNNAESRGTGGNPAALVLLTIDQGVLQVTAQASSADFDNGRAEPIVALDDQTVALYGSKVGRYMQDVTTTPDFSESARIMSAFWAESFGTPIDGVASIDPVALSHLLAASGPVDLPTGDQLTADNAASLLLNEVYFRYSDPQDQDAFFAAAAAAVFQRLTATSDVRALADAALRAIDEGRILYAPGDARQRELLAGTRILGAYPDTNADVTLLAAYVNDITEGKLDYYLGTAISVESDLCTTSGAPTFVQNVTLASSLDPADVPGLARYISPARFFPKGVISTDLVVYGPVDATVTGVTVDGAAVGFTPLVHLGRPAVKVNVINEPSNSHTVGVTFAGQPGDYGPVEVWHTPMVGPTEITIDTPGCTP